MTKQGLYNALSGVATTYFDRAKVGEAIPYIVYTWTYPNNFPADDVVYQRIASVQIQLYSSDPADADRLAEVLDELGLYWTSSQNYELDDKVYVSTYDMEVIEG